MRTNKSIAAYLKLGKRASTKSSLKPRAAKRQGLREALKEIGWRTFRLRHNARHGISFAKRMALVQHVTA